MGIGMCIVGFNVQINTIQVILETILRAIGYDPSNSVVALKDMKLVNQIAGHEIAHENARQSRKARNCTNAWLQKEINSFILSGKQNGKPFQTAPMARTGISGNTI